MKLLKLPNVLRYTAKSRTSHYNDIKNGLMTPPVKLGENSVAWPVHEINAIIAARIAGKDDLEIREIVADLVAARKKIACRAGEIASESVLTNHEKQVIYRALESDYITSGVAASPKEMNTTLDRFKRIAGL